MKCPDRTRWHYRTPEFVEQLIPLSILNHYKITTNTPIHSPLNGNKHSHPPYIHGDPVIEIHADEDGKNVRATLATYNLPSSSVKENKRVLEAFGEVIGKKVAYVDVPVKKILKSKKSSKSAGVT
jgi:hypothetical protein